MPYFAYADLSIEDYAERTAQTRPAWEATSGKQTNDPAKLAKALLTVVDPEQPPLRWVAGADAVATVEQKANDLLAQVNAYRALSSSVAVEERDRTRFNGSIPLEGLLRKSRKQGVLSSVLNASE